jgi:hypothetical protein
MKYYKIRREGTIVAVCSELDFRRWQKKHSVIVVSDANRVEAVQVGEVFYRDIWMAAESGGIESIPAEVIEISEEEYAALVERLKTEEEFAEVVEIEPPPAEEPETPPEEPVKKTVGQLLAEQQARIDELSRQLVTAGIYGGV